MRTKLAFLPLVILLAQSSGCGEDDPGPEDAGPSFCPTGAPEVGTSCSETVGICPYEALNPACPPLVGECRCVQGGWACSPPECTTCNESCNGDCCNLDDVCRATADGLRQECGAEGDGSLAMFEPCGHASDCFGPDPICSPICGDLCCTFTCEGQGECEPGTCTNGVCAPPD